MSNVPRYDSYSPSSEQASRTLAAVGRKDTKPEMTLRRALWARGLRYRLHSEDLSGRPDLVFRRQQVAVFCDGDFWHGKDWAERRRRLRDGANPSYWLAKIRGNMERDQRNTRVLTSSGWTVLRFWESDILEDLDAVVARIDEVLRETVVDDDQQ